MSMQAIIMAGGEGARLRPLTVQLPKPLVPLLGEPVMGYALKLLKAHGITEVGVTLCYQPKKIRRAFGKGEKYGLRLHYYEESAPMGTAGSILMAKDQMAGTFFVLSGDGLTDCDLTRALSFHREKKALATLVLRRVSVPLPYGVVMCDEESRITRFIEKPTWSRVFSDLVNTGIYILEPEIFDHIPDQGTPDFGRDIFPSLLEKQLPVYGFETTGYWCDVGDQRAYLAAQQALLRGDVALPYPESQEKEAIIDGSARLQGRCWIGRGARIGQGALIENSVIGDQCVVGPGAVISDSCLWPGAAVQERAWIQGSVLCDGAAVRKCAQLADGCALGQGAVAGAGAELWPGVKVFPHLKAAAGAVTRSSIITGDLSAPLWTSQGADCQSAEHVCALAQAFAQVMGARRVLTGRAVGCASLQALANGALGASGAEVLSAGEMSQGMLQWVLPVLKADGGIFAREQSLAFFDGKGRPLSSRQLSTIEARLQRLDGPPHFAGTGKIIPLSGLEELYLSRVLPEKEKPLWSPVAVFCDHPLLRRVAGEGLQRMGCRDARLAPAGDMQLRPDETAFLLTEQEELHCFSGKCTLSPEQQVMLLLSLYLKEEGVLYDLPGIPRAAARLASLKQADASQGCIRQGLLLTDGLASLFTLCQALKEGPLEMLLSGLPETHILKMDIPCQPRDKGRILRNLCSGVRLPHTLGEGVTIQHERGCASIVPDAYRGLVRITSESADSEFAKELCDFYQHQISRMQKENKTNL